MNAHEAVLEVERQYRAELAVRGGAPTVTMLRALATAMAETARLALVVAAMPVHTVTLTKPEAHEHNAVRFDINPKPGTGLLVDECSCGARRTRDYRGLVGEGGSPKVTPWRMLKPKRKRKAAKRVGRRGSR